MKRYRSFEELATDLRTKPLTSVNGFPSDEEIARGARLERDRLERNRIPRPKQKESPPPRPMSEGRRGHKKGVAEARAGLVPPFSKPDHRNEHQYKLEGLKYIERGDRSFTVITGLPCATCRYGDELPEELRMTPFQHEAWHAYYAFHALNPFAYGRERFRTDKVIERFMKRVYVHWDWPIRTATRYPPGCLTVVKESYWNKPVKAWKHKAPAAWYHPTCVQNHALLEAAYRVLHSYLGDDGESEEPPPMPAWWDPEHPNQAGAFHNRVEREARYELQRRFKYEKHKRGTVRWSAFDSEDGIYSRVYDQDSRSSALLRYLQDEPTRQLNKFGRREQVSARLNRFVRYLPQEQQRAVKLFLAGATPEQAAEAILVHEWRNSDALVGALTDALTGDAGAVEWTHEEVLKPVRERYERNLQRAFTNPAFVQNIHDGYTPPEHVRLF